MIHYLFFLYIFFLPFQTRYIFAEGFLNGNHSEFLTISLYATEILLWIILLYGFFKIIQEKRKGNVNFFSHSSFKQLCLFIFITATIFSLVIAESFFIGYFLLFHLLEGVALYTLLTRGIVSKKLFFLAMASSGVLQAGLALFQFFTQRVFSSTLFGMSAQNASFFGISSVIETSSERFLRAYGTLSHPNILGGFFVYSLIASFFLYMNASTKKTKATFLAIFLFEFLGLLVSFSRSAYLAFFVGFFILTIFYLRTHARAIAFVSLSLLVIASMFFVLFPQIFLTRVFANQRLERISLDERKNQIALSHSVLSEHWLSGVGIGNYSLFVSRNFPLSGKTPEPVHSMIHLVFSETGIFGFFSLFIFVSIKVIKNIRERNTFGISLLSGIIIISLFDHYLWSMYFGIILFWCILATSDEKIFILSQKDNIFIMS